MSNIKITVDWAGSAVFAGDDVECVITFQNVAPAPVRARPPSSFAHLRASEPRRPLRRSELSRQRTPTSRNLSLPQGNVGSASVDTLPLAASSSGTVQQPQHTQDTVAKLNAQKHGRSISIISMGSNTPLSGPKGRSAGRNYSPHDKRPHLRTTSLQGVQSSTSSSSAINTLTSSWLTTHPASFHVSRQLGQLSFEQGETPNTSELASSFEWGSRGFTRKPEDNGHAQEADGEKSGGDKPQRVPSTVTTSLRPGDQMSQRSRSAYDTISSIHGNGSSKAASAISANPTPRSSLEVYSQSNHSSETLASEYVLPISTYRGAGAGGYLNHPMAPPASTTSEAPSEVLMMGYVQLNGSFVLDGSLINLIPFEPIKKKGVIGGQGGGGVVGIGSTKRDSGLLSSLGWSNISQSLGELVGGQEPSSMREMKGIASTKAIPILSTPQSILFVDLRLGAGEARRFRYRHRLPRVLPPSCKGRAIKITYQLTVGVQRPQSPTKSQHLSHISAPFKVLPSARVNVEAPIYDLKSPYIILQNAADLQPVSNNSSIPWSRPSRDPSTLHGSDGPFSSFVSHLLGEQLGGLNQVPLSPTELSTPTHTGVEKHTANLSTKNVIDTHISRGDLLAASKAVSSRFDIHRFGQRVATIMLARSAYKLGDTIIASIDFRRGHVPCFSFHAHLETSEEVEEALALRSNASILRATRRIHASQFENTIGARRIVSRFIIPLAATPDFKTSGVSLEWALRFEFTIKSKINADDSEVFDEIAADERGKIIAAAQELQTESFEVSIPVRVFGTIDTSTNYPSTFII